MDKQLCDKIRRAVWHSGNGVITDGAIQVIVKVLKTSKDVKSDKRHIHADVIVAWAEGKDVQARSPISGEWSDLSRTMACFYEDWEYRIKPSIKKYRAALFTEPTEGVFVANSAEQEASYEEFPNFIRWLTDWVEYEE
jgi:hypothetical protein